MPPSKPQYSRNSTTDPLCINTGDIASLKFGRIIFVVWHIEQKTTLNVKRFDSTFVDLHSISMARSAGGKKIAPETNKEGNNRAEFPIECPIPTLCRKKTAGTGPSGTSNLAARRWGSIVVVLLECLESPASWREPQEAVIKQKKRWVEKNCHFASDFNKNGVADAWHEKVEVD